MFSSKSVHSVLHKIIYEYRSFTLHIYFLDLPYFHCIRYTRALGLDSWTNVRH